MPFNPREVGSGAGWPQGVVAEYFRDLPSSEVDVLPGTHTRVTVLMPAQKDEPPLVQRRIGERSCEAVLTQPTLCVAPAGQDQAWCWKGRLASFNVSLPGTLLHRVVESAQDAGDQTVQSDIALRGRPAFQDAQLTSLMTQMAAELHSSGPASVVLTDALTQAIGVLLLRQCAGRPHADAAPARRRKQPAGLSQRQLAEVRSFILTNLDQPFTLDHVAKSVGCARRTFTRQCRQATGQTACQMILDVRLEQAMKLLKRDELTLEAVAQKVGFSDQSHLRRQLKKATGQTAAVLRKQLAGAAQSTATRQVAVATN